MQTKWDIGNSYIWIESILQSRKSHFNCLYHCWPFIKVLPLRKQLREKLCIHSLITTHDLEYYGNKHYVIIKLLYSWLRLINLRSLSDKVLVKPWRGQGGGRVCTSEGYSLSSPTWSLTPAGGKVGANGLLRAEEWTALHIKESVWLGHGWPFIGNSLKWRTISYPVIWCDSPCNSTLSRCTSPIYIPNHSKFAFYHYGSSERGAKRCAHEETTQTSGFRCLAHYHSAFPSPFTSTSLFHPHTETLPALLSTLELISPGPFLRKPNFTKTDPSSLKKKTDEGARRGLNVYLYGWSPRYVRWKPSAEQRDFVYKIEIYTVECIYL